MLKTHRPLAFFDVDNTLLKGQSQRFCIEYFYKKNFLPLVSYLRIITWFLLYKLHIVNNPQAILNYAMRFSKGMKKEDFKKEIDEFFDTVLVKKIYTESLDLIKERKNSGFQIVLLTNTFDILAEKIASYVGADYVISTKLAYADGLLLGGIDGEPAYGENKARLIHGFVAQKGFSLEGSYGYGDHITDIPFLNLVEHPVVVNPNRTLGAFAQSRGWSACIIKI